MEISNKTKIEGSPFWLARRAAIFFAPIALAVVLFEGFFYLGGENLPLESVLERQQEGEPQFMRGYLDQELQRYKVLGAFKHRADYLAVGSSRVLGLREQFFPSSFYNAGGILQYGADLEFLASFLESNGYIPRVVLVAVDPWWFSNQAKTGAYHLDVAISRPEAARDWRSHWRGIRRGLARFVLNPRLILE